MNDCRMKIMELRQRGNMLDINIRLRCPYDPRVKYPKISIIFTNLVETRRLPLLIQSYFPSEDMASCTILAKYTYNLERLFLNVPDNDRIDFWFELTYGETIVDKVTFELGQDAQLENALPIEGNTVLSLIKMEDETVIKKKQPNKLVTGVRTLIRGIWSFLLVILVIALLPVFIVEGLLAVFGCVRQAPKNGRRGLRRFIYHLQWRINRFTRLNFGISAFKYQVLFYAFGICSKLKVKKNQVVFISSRREDLTGNFQFIYNILKNDKQLQLKFLLDPRSLKKMSFRHIWLYGYYCATSGVILLDDFTAITNQMPRRQGTIMIQLWHACGAFKTFGFSRLGRPGGPKQTGTNHRNYDYAIVSSQKIAKHYAEGFGISLDKAIATGIPRTDIFFDEAYKTQVRQTFYETHPDLKGRKLLLFAPTFRGNGKMSGYYPQDKFDPIRMYEELDEEYIILIKHHPYVNNKPEVPEEYRDRILDLSDQSELNDLLFVADLLITDYSSVIFEAALLNVPMLFYAYDLEWYISSRGFYCEFEQFVPGKIVRSFEQAVKAIKNEDFEPEKIEKFKTQYFDELDGKSSERTVQLIYDSMKR